MITRNTYKIQPFNYELFVNLTIYDNFFHFLNICKLHTNNLFTEYSAKKSKGEPTMNKDTVNLLKECNSGCKMATNGMEHVMSYVKDSSLKKLIDDYNDRHISLGDKCHTLLNSYGENERDPHQMARAMSWISTEVKLSVNSDSRQIKNILINGCAMGIKSISGYIEQYPTANGESMHIAHDLIGIEQDFMEKLSV